MAGKAQAHDIDEDMLRELCAISNQTTTSRASAKKKGEGVSSGFRDKNTSASTARLMSGNTTKSVKEDISLDLEGDIGTDGRPRVREEIKLPPNYEEIDLNDPNDEILF